jgi:tRNA(Ile2) C34 agmatinyltransferase TiaS
MYDPVTSKCKKCGKQLEKKFKKRLMHSRNCHPEWLQTPPIKRRGRPPKALQQTKNNQPELEAMDNE